MKRFSFGLVLVALALPAAAQDEKAQSCGYQAQVVSAVQQARLDRVKESDVPQAVADTDPEWPANFNAAIPLVAPWVYDLPMKDVREQDLGEAWNELCLQQ